MSAAPDRAPEDSRWHGLQVFLVEDHADSREVLQQVLEYEGARVTTAVDGADALRRLQSASPDVMLVDVRLPVLDGLQLVSRLRRDLRWARVPMIAVTAYTAPSDLLATLQAGFDAHIGKPVDFDALTAVMTRLVATRRPPRGRGPGQGGGRSHRTRRPE